MTTGSRRVADLLSGFHLNCQLPKNCACGPMKAEFIGFSLLSLCHGNNVQSRTVSVQDLSERKLTTGDISELPGAKWTRGKH